MLDASQSEAKQVARLSSLVNLERLGLSHATAKDIALLKPLSNLVALELYSLVHPNLKPLAALPRVEDLAVSTRFATKDGPGGGLESLSGIEKLRYLKRLSVRLDPSPTNPVDLRPLRGLTELREVTLLFGPFSHFEALRQLRLESVLIYGSDDLDVTRLNPEALRRLDVSYLQQQLVPSLVLLEGLEHLQVSSEDFGDLHLFSKMKRLRELFLRGTVGSLTGIAGLSQLESLFIDSDSEIDLAPLASLRKLTRLNLARVRVTRSSLNEFVKSHPACKITFDSEAFWW